MHSSALSRPAFQNVTAGLSSMFRKLIPAGSGASIGSLSASEPETRTFRPCGIVTAHGQ